MTQPSFEETNSKLEDRLIQLNRIACESKVSQAKGLQPNISAIRAGGMYSNRFSSVDLSADQKYSNTYMD